MAASPSLSVQSWLLCSSRPQVISPRLAVRYRLPLKNVSCNSVSPPSAGLKHGRDGASLPAKLDFRKDEIPTKNDALLFVGSGTMASEFLLFANLLMAHPALADGTAEEAVTTITEETEKVAQGTPGWLTPVLLVFPLVVYAGFTVFRAKVNPRASILDFLFILVALFIIFNILTILTLGVRLY